MTLFQRWLMRTSGEAKFAPNSDAERCVFASVSVVKKCPTLRESFSKMSESDLESFFSNLETEIKKAIQE